MKDELTTRKVSAYKPKKTYYKVWDTKLKGFFLRVMPENHKGKCVKTFCIYYRHNGRGTEYTLGKLGKVTYDQAHTLAKIKLGEIAAETDIQTEKKARVKAEKLAKTESLGAFIENEYKPYVLADPDRSTAQDTLDKLNQSFSHLFHIQMSELTPWHIKQWRSERAKQGVKAATQNRQLMALKGAMSKAVEWEVIDKHPLKNVKPLKTDTKSKVRYLSDVEEKRLRKALDDREARIRQERISTNAWRKVRSYKQHKDLSKDTFVDYLKPLVLTALNTGMRRGELFNLEWKNIELKNRNLTIEGLKAKSKKTRHIPLNDQAFATLTAWANQTDCRGLVFPSPVTKKRMVSIKKTWGSLCKEAKLNNFRFHDLRHTFASKLVMKNIDLNTVRELLGHSDLKMTLRYAHLSPAHTLEAVKVLDA